MKEHVVTVADLGRMPVTRNDKLRKKIGLWRGVSRWWKRRRFYVEQDESRDEEEGPQNTTLPTHVAEDEFDTESTQQADPLDINLKQKRFVTALKSSKSVFCS